MKGCFKGKPAPMGRSMPAMGGTIKPLHGTAASPFPQVRPTSVGKGVAVARSPAVAIPVGGKGYPSGCGKGSVPRPSLGGLSAGGSGIGRLLATADLGPFENAIKRLGVESASDFKYVTSQDLAKMNMTVIQRRKFEEMVKNADPTGGQGGGGGRGRSRSPRRSSVIGKPFGKDSGKGKGSTKNAPAPPWQTANQAAPRQFTPAARLQGTVPKGGHPATVPKGGQLATFPRVAKPKEPSGPPPQSVVRAASAPPMSGDDVVKEAEKRLRENGARKFYWAEVAKLKLDYKLSERVELALKLLAPVKLSALLRNSDQLTRMLQQAGPLPGDKDKLIRSLVARQDPIVDKLVTQLEQKETQRAKGGSKGGKLGKGDDNRSVGGFKKKW